ncbi:hypothetical protein [Novosphingobium sp. KN65.2]|uniref:hypothetical protein n=1 Tax=Novosphingobium sp. KN65.2 TaxID=1478134 RepID=UPI0005E2D8BB|nr:hypothetical protein [Novosphingobium sp. KN65.2]CDO38847.1 hypothetical protein SPHV1_780010 [Novosphingobium sp. KN65.2]
MIEPVAAPADLPFEERYALLLWLYVRYSAEHARITFSKTIAGGERLEWMVEEFVKANHAATRAYAATLIERGLVPDMPLPSLVYAIVGMVRLPFVLAREAQLAMGYDFMKGKAIDAHANCAIQLLMHR